MALDITGKILQIMPVTTGTSKAGKEWKKREFILETQEAYPRNICIGVMGEKVDELSRFKSGDEIKASLNIESREYNGKWYTNVNAWRLEAVSGGGQAGGSQEAFTPDPEPSFTPDSSTDDLPF